MENITKYCRASAARETLVRYVIWLVIFDAMCIITYYCRASEARETLVRYLFVADFECKILDVDFECKMLDIICVMLDA